MSRSAANDTKGNDKALGGSRRFLVLTVVVVFIIGAVAGVAIYRDRVAPFRVAVLEVDDASVTMRYFLKRLQMSGDNPMAVFETIMREMIIRQAAPLAPFNLDISDEDVDRFMETLATGDSQAITEDELEEWYRQLANETPLSDSELRELLHTNLAGIQINEHLSQRVPTVDEQVHISMIIVESFQDATELKERLSAGEDFGELSQELNTEERLQEQGGDLGWFPRCVLSPSLEAVAFALDINQVSEPLSFGEQFYAVVRITERAAARTIAEDALQIIRSRAMENWFAEELTHHEITIRGLKNGYDSETDAWVSWQLEQMGQ